METPVDLHHLSVFSAVADELSFSRAALRLGISKGTVSRSVAALERQLGVELLHRSTHSVSLSTAGAELQERTRAHVHALRAAVVELPEQEDEPAGLLRLTAPPDFGLLVLTDVVAAFSRRHPLVRFDIRLTNAYADIVKEGHDLAIRVAVGPMKDSSLTVRRLGRGAAGFFAAPTYLARRGRPRQLGDDRHTWVLHPVVQRLVPTDRPPRFQVDSFLAVRDMLRAGLGVGMLPGFLARPYVREGLLEAVTLDSPPLADGEVVMVYPASGPTPKKVKAFRDFLVESLRASGGL